MKIIYASGYYDKQAKKIVDKAIEETRRLGWLKKFSMVKGNRNDPEDLKEPFDIYHCHAGHSLETIHLAKKLGAKIILQRDSAHQTTMISLLNEYKEKCRQLNREYKDICNINPISSSYQLDEYDQADYILLASTWERDTFIENGVSKDKLKIIPFTADSEIFKPKTLNRPFSVVLGGNQCLRKGFPYAKEACRKLDIPLNVIEGQKFEHMPGILNNYSVCLAPAVEDGYPHQVLASMACGLVPIVSTFNGVRDLIKHGKNGFIVDLTDPNVIEDIMEILNELKRSPEWMMELGAAARKTLSQRTWADYSKDIVKFYKEVMK